MNVHVEYTDKQGEKQKEFYSDSMDAIRRKEELAKEGIVASAVPV